MSSLKSLVYADACILGTSQKIKTNLNFKLIFFVQYLTVQLYS